MKATARARRYPRIQLPKGMQVAWQGGGRRGLGHVSTMGLGGLFIAAPDPPAGGTFVALFFELPYGEVRANAIVRDAVPGAGMGVEFIGMKPEDRARLHQLLKKLLGE